MQGRIHSTVRLVTRGLGTAFLLMAVMAVTAWSQTTEVPGDPVSDAPAVTDAVQQDSVEVTLVSFEIQIPTTLTAGTTTFNITNAGDVEHGFDIEGGAVAEELSPILPGETQSLTVDLEPGTYIVYCPVDDHREQGMEVTVTVE